VVFSSDATNLVPGDTNGHADIFVRDLKLGTTRRVSLAPNEAQADGDSYSPALSPDRRLVTFESDATNLVPGDTNGVTDVFVRAR
jgi:Tol biopolymer transport system component